MGFFSPWRFGGAALSSLASISAFLKRWWHPDLGASLSLPTLLVGGDRVLHRPLEIWGRCCYFLPSWLGRALLSLLFVSRPSEKMAAPQEPPQEWGFGVRVSQAGEEVGRP